MRFFLDASGIANFCTIILFVLFIIGKIWRLQRNRSLYNENFQYMIDSSQCSAGNRKTFLFKVTYSQSQSLSVFKAE